MRRVSGPSRSSLLAAWRLGRKMARQERRIRPNLRNATHFSRYDDFRLAHRSAIENTRIFPAWEQRIEKLAEGEGYRVGYNLDKTSRTWDDFFTYIFTPIKHAFWLGWEDARQLQPMYKQRRSSLAHGSKALTTAANVFRVAETAPTLPESTPDELSEEDRWDAIAEKLFDELPGDKDEQLWELPEANSIGAKANAS